MLVCLYCPSIGLRYCKGLWYKSSPFLLVDDAGRQQTSHLGTVILTEDSAKVHTFLGLFLAFDLADFPNCAAGVLYFFASCLLSICHMLENNRAM